MEKREYGCEGAKANVELTHKPIVKKCSKMYKVKEKRKIGIQVGCPSVERVERGIQCSNSKSSYGRKEKEAHHVTFEDLLQNYLWDKEYTILVERRGFYCVETTMWIMSVEDELDGV